MLRCMSPVLAQSGHPSALSQCLLLEVKRPSDIGTATELLESMALTVHLHQSFCASPLENDWV